jgi:hypothetical protein
MPNLRTSLGRKFELSVDDCSEPAVQGAIQQPATFIYGRRQGGPNGRGSRFSRGTSSASSPTPATRARTTRSVACVRGFRFQDPRAAARGGETAPDEYRPDLMKPSRRTCCKCCKVGYIEQPKCFIPLSRRPVHCPVLRHYDESPKRSKAPFATRCMTLRLKLPGTLVLSIINLNYERRFG